MGTKTTFLLQHELVPTAGGPQVEYGGAFAVCWAVAGQARDARADVAKLLLESGWTVLATTEERAVEREDVPEESLSYFEQAQIDGTVIRVHTFPLDA